MNETNPEIAIVEQLVAKYGDFLTVRQVAEMVEYKDRTICKLLVHQDPRKRIPGFKVGKTWAIPTVEFADYLRAHFNGALPSGDASSE